MSHIDPEVCVYSQYLFGIIRCRLDKSVCTECKGGVCDVYQISPLLDSLKKGEINK